MYRKKKKVKSVVHRRVWYLSDIYTSYILSEVDREYGTLCIFLSATSEHWDFLHPFEGHVVERKNVFSFIYDSLSRKNF